MISLRGFPGVKETSPEMLNCIIEEYLSLATQTQRTNGNKAGKYS